MKRVLLSVPLVAALAMTTFTQDEPEGRGRPQARDRQGDYIASPALRSLVEAERAFARRSLEVGWREAFLEFFADDAISFTPAPGNAKERLRQRPATPRPLPYTLDWWPVFAGISAAEDMGFTTGPSVGVDNTKPGSPPDYGYYFSVWKRQPGGAWKVALDIGVQTPGLSDQPSARRRIVAAPRPTWSAKRRESNPEKARAQLEKERAALLKIEREMFKPDRNGYRNDAEGPVGDYGSSLLREARLHRSGQLPLVDSDAILSYLYLRAARIAWQPAAVDVSLSGDMAYTYGSYDFVTRGEGGAPDQVEQGHYAHVWQRDERGNWLLVADVMHATPAGK